MNVQELCRKLKPVIGEKADRYWLAYLAEDHRGKQDIETALNLLADHHLGSLGRAIPERRRWGSTEHEFWKHKVAKKIRDRGWKAAIEESKLGFTDIVATKAKHKIAVEIETGKSDWRSNIQKNIQSGFENILILATNQATLQKSHRKSWK